MHEYESHSWPPLGHLRRVRRTKYPVVAQEIVSDPKRLDDLSTTNSVTKTVDKYNVKLEILIGSVIQINDLLDSQSHEEYKRKINHLLTHYSLKLEKRMLPGRPARTLEELELWNSQQDGDGWWPTLFFEEQTNDFKQKILEIDASEKVMMMRGMEEALADAKKYRDDKLDYFDGAVVMCPVSGHIVSRSYKEFQIKIKSHGPQEIGNVKSLLLANPLNTSTLLSIQGVSRIERDMAMGNGMCSEAFKQGQYLLTGYDMYLTREPGTFEAMAALHSRIRRVIFGIPNLDDGGLTKLQLHCLPGTNHRFRVFQCIESHIVSDCQSLYKI